MLITSLIVTSLLSLAAPQHPGTDSTYADSIRGQLITTVTTSGNFVSFDKAHPDRFFLRDASDQMLMNVIRTAPETDLFLADHAKDDLKITYQVRVVSETVGSAERVNYVIKLRSLRTGDDVKDWPEKLQDSSRLERCEEELRRIHEIE